MFSASMCSLIFGDRIGVVVYSNNRLHTVTNDFYRVTQHTKWNANSIKQHLMMRSTCGIHANGSKTNCLD